MADVPPIIAELVERFDRNRKQYLAKTYKEAQVRNEFIDPFFEELGWDMANTRGRAEAYKDVIHEDAIKIGGTTKAPDYAFRVGGTRKFFVEAKCPEMRIAFEPEPAYQLRRYSWNKKLPIGILTNFMEMAVYDCRFPPRTSDKPSLGRVKYVKYTEYLDRWGEIAGIFDREEVLRGSFDRYAESTKSKRGTAEVDSAFLAEIEQWRRLLAHNIALRNRLQVEELNYAVQRTIDRIIFLRMCEDRGIEVYGSLQTLANGGNIYPRLCQLYLMADDRYNSGLFHFKLEKARAEGPDELTLGIKIDDKVLKDILKGLYYPCPYEFSAIPSDILGNVYEQFLGKVIVLKSPTNATVEEKPEVKKAGGVYYTPTYIVDYIVKSTVNRLCDGKTPRQMAEIRVLDPACGSGSFLLGAYNCLLDRHRDWYVEHSPEKYKKEIYEGRGGQWYLAGTEKKRILLNNIYGADIDRQAVEVTKLNLLLKVLEGETQETVNSSLKLLHERALPDLANNIKCGNSLIGSDFFVNHSPNEISEDDRRRINAFDWSVEFADIMKSGGFDAVIGNPPWGADIDRELEYYHARYPATTQEHTDSFKLFVEQATELANSDGFVAMIVPSTLLRQRRLKDVRQLMLAHCVLSLVDLGENVFPRVIAPSAIYVLRKCKSVANIVTCFLDLSRESQADKPIILQSPEGHEETLAQDDFIRNADFEFRSVVGKPSVPVIALGDLTDVSIKDAGINYQRVKVGMQEKGKSDLADRLLYEGSQQDPRDRMYWKGVDIDRYQISEETGRFCRPHIHLRANEVVHLNKAVYDTRPKILLRQTADRVIATIDYKGIWFGRSIIAIVPKQDGGHQIEYYLGILNSRYLKQIYGEITRETGRVFAQVKLSKLKQLPIHILDFDDQTDKARHDRMVKLVESMLALHKKLPEAKTPDEKTRIQRRIDATDRQIDALVYELYSLTEEEIKIVEEAT